MKLQDDFEDRSGMTPTVVMTIIAVTVFVAVILMLVLLLNDRKRPGRPEQSTGESQEFTSPVITSEPLEIGSGSGLHPDSLDFWDKYPEKESSSETEQSSQQAEEKNDPATDGKHTLVTYTDGSEEWVLISPYLPKHEYDFTKMVCQSGLMKYYENGKQISYVGVDVSKNQDYIDFIKVKKAGISFVMIRAGARGYGTGQLIVDEYFSDNLKRATDAGLAVGVYFYSQAVTEEEAIEEANLVLQNLGEYTIAYPIAFEMELITNDTARTDGLRKADRTKIAKAFLDTVAAAGYKTALYGNKQWLIKEIDMSKLTAYDVWLTQPGDIPDYPYKFTMWQYNTKGQVDGISGYVNLNISFIDYTEK